MVCGIADTDNLNEHEQKVNANARESIQNIRTNKFGDAENALNK